MVLIGYRMMGNFMFFRTLVFLWLWRKDAGGWLCDFRITGISSGACVASVGKKTDPLSGLLEVSRLTFPTRLAAGPGYSHKKPGVNARFKADDHSILSTAEPREVTPDNCRSLGCINYQRPENPILSMTTTPSGC